MKLISPKTEICKTGICQTDINKTRINKNINQQNIDPIGANYLFRGTGASRMLLSDATLMSLGYLYLLTKNARRNKTQSRQLYDRCPQRAMPRLYAVGNQ